MQKRLLFLIVVIVTIPVTLITAQPNVTRKVICSIGAGENLVYGENCLELSTAQSNVYIVTQIYKNNAQTFFTYDNGTRKGPFTKTSVPVKVCKSEYECAAYMPNDEDIDASTYVSLNDMGQTVIKFQNKTYGPYLQIADFKLTSNKAKFYAAIQNQEGSSLICSDGRKVAVKGMPGSVVMNEDGSNALVVGLGSLSLQDMMSGNINADDLANYFVYTIDGQKFGPYKDGFNSDAVWFQGKNWFFYMDGSLYMNGKLLFNSETTIDKCTFWISADGKRWAFADYEKINFSDGKTYPFPLKMVKEEEAGKIFIKWVSIENSKDIVLYRREI